MRMGPLNPNTHQPVGDTIGMDVKMYDEHHPKEGKYLSKNRSAFSGGFKIP
jgi:hypothetical protein